MDPMSCIERQNCLELLRLVHGAAPSESHRFPALYRGILAIDCPYARRHFIDAFSRRPWWHIDQDVAPGPTTTLQLDEYERVDWDRCMEDPARALVTNNFCVRKGLSRKANFGSIMTRFAERYPSSALARALPLTAVIDTMPVFHSRPVWLDFWAAMNESLLEAEEVMDAATAEWRQALAPAGAGAASDASDGSSDGPAELPPLPLPLEQQPLWILKPSLANKGAEITIVRSIAEVSAFVRAWRDVGQWVLQRYIERPLLLGGGRKFHARVYVLVNAAMEVYVFREALLLFAVEGYRAAGGDISSISNTHAHITNTCVNAGHAAFDESRFVKRLSDLPQLIVEEKVETSGAALGGAALGGAALGGAALGGAGAGAGAGAVVGQGTAPAPASSAVLTAAAPADVAAAASRLPPHLLSSAATAAAVYSSICGVVGDVFAALERETATYMPLESSFELYGADFVMEETETETEGKSDVPRVRVLEFNPTPDIKQTGSRLDYMIAALVEGTVAIAVDSRFPPPAPDAPAAASPAVAGPRVVPREVMREPPLAAIQQSYFNEWVRAVDAEGRSAPARATGKREGMLVWDRVLSLPPSAAASKGGMRCF